MSHETNQETVEDPAVVEDPAEVEDVAIHVSLGWDPCREAWTLEEHLQCYFVVMFVCAILLVFAYGVLYPRISHQLPT